MVTKMFSIESNQFCQYLSDATKRHNFQRSNEKIVWNKESYLEDGTSYCNSTIPFIERYYSLFSIYYNNFVNKVKPIKPQSWEKDIDPENFFSDLKIHYNQFTGLLKGYESKINPTRDILEFERETDLFFLLKVYSMLPTGKIDKFPTNKEKRNYLKALATVSLIEDIRLKLYLAEQMIKEGNEFLFIKSKEGYIRLFILIFLYVPLLKEFIKDHIKAPADALKIKNEEVDKEEASRLRSIKKKLYLYVTLEDGTCYSVEDLKDDPDFQMDTSGLEYSNDFFELYKIEKKVPGIRANFCKRSIHSFLNEIRILTKFPEDIFNQIEELFYQQGYR